MNKAQLNYLLSVIATKHENDIRRICKETNIYYPPPWYRSIRGSKLGQDLLKELLDEH